MKISDIFFHDSEILKVTEYPTYQNLEYHLLMPENWDENIFIEKKIIFYNVIFYSVNEIPFGSNPIILNVIDHGKIEKNCNNWIIYRNKIEIQTNAGDRIIEFEKFEVY